MNKEILRKEKIEKFRDIFTKSRSINFFEKCGGAIENFSVTEKVIFYTLVTILCLSSLSLIWNVNSEFLVEVPASGGSLTEGVIGSPRFINPLLAVSDADKDLVSLVYSGLLKSTPDGNLIKDLAENYTISPDGLTYTFTLKNNLHFQDGKPITTEDIEFTIKKAQDDSLKSTKRANWDGVIVEKINAKEISFTLKQPYSPFLENITLGILPKHIWGDVSSDQFAFSQFNVEPIGSGPYKIKNIKRNSSGFPVFYTLKPFSGYALGEAHISTLTLYFYPNENEAVKAWKSGTVEGINSISPETATELMKTGAEIEISVLPRIFGVFFNQNKANVFVNKEVRQALDMTLNKNRIVKEVLKGYGVTIDSPIPQKDTPKTIVDQSETSASTTEAVFDEAKNLLQKAGWKLNEKTGLLEKKTKAETFSLKFSISTGDAPELVATAQIIKENWEKLGVSVDIKIFETSDLNQNIIRPRKYEALLFGEVIGHGLDLFPFWHSSQRNDPG
ncbi:MAG: hypothetical protein HQ402_01595, partial [Parcubacteria group bacterium]|nr:hypothetical protein [Parcubacteria group bacterium]